MKIASSYADVIKDWEALELAMQDNAANLPAEMESRRVAFVAHVAKVKELKARQDSLTAARQETTQQLNSKRPVNSRAPGCRGSGARAPSSGLSAVSGSGRWPGSFSRPGA